jgi:glucuronate isomerase
MITTNSVRGRVQVEELIGSPLCHWTHLELRRYFGINKPLTHKSAPDIWEKTNGLLGDISVKDIFKKFNVYAVGTTDDPIDSLEHHAAIAAGRAAIGAIDTKVPPSSAILKKAASPKQSCTASIPPPTIRLPQ